MHTLEAVTAVVVFTSCQQNEDTFEQNYTTNSYSCKKR
jgi:hypothetical protein